MKMVTTKLWVGALWSLSIAACAHGEAIDTASNEQHDPLSAACSPGTSVGCTVSGEVCAVGKRYCSADGTWGACVPSLPSAEICGDGVDNDCSGVADDCPGGGTGGTGATSGGSGGSGGAPEDCVPGQPIACVSACGTQGSSSCEPPRDCVPPAEICDNGIDDDCDGAVDENCGGTTHDCDELMGYHDCNSDPGYGDHCSPADNLAGCDPAWFAAWCNRRNGPQGEAAWDAAVKGWVDAHCDGAVTVSGSSYQCKDSSGTVWQCTTPLVLAFDDAPVAMTPSCGSFALAGAGSSIASDWPTADTPWLALDRNDNGRVDDGSELFGEAVRLASGAFARNGFEALAELDSDRDGRITRGDAAWSSLRAWSDRDGDRASQPGELRTLDDLGIDALELSGVSAPRCDARGNCEIERSRFESGRGRGWLVDLYLAVR